MATQINLFDQSYLPIYELCLKQTGVMAFDRPYLNSPDAVNDVAEKYLADAPKEHFVVLFLNVKNMLIGVHTVAIGAIDRCIISPVEVFKPAFLVNAAAILLVHNHPSGDTNPSDEDKRLTQHLVKLGHELSLPVVDHLIVGHNGSSYSFKANGLII